MNFVHSLGPLTQQIGMFSYVIFFLLIFWESFVFIGLVVPGAPITVIAGFLALEGDLNIFATLVVITLGAVLGDYCSYVIGTKGTHLFKSESRILKRGHLDRAERFFHKHGGKSIFLARFYPLRPIIPFVAGLSKMKKGRFIFWDIISVIVWVIFYFCLGYFFSGALRKIEEWSERASTYILLGTFIAIIIYAVIKRLPQKKKSV